MLLSCHTDTVTPGAAVTPVERDGVIYSDGTTILGSDDKSGIAEIIEAVARLKENGEKNRPVEVLFSSRKRSVCSARAMLTTAR